MSESNELAPSLTHSLTHSQSLTVIHSLPLHVTHSLTVSHSLTVTHSHSLPILRSFVRSFVLQTSAVVRSSFVVRRSSFVVRRSSFVVRRSSLVVGRWSLVVRRHSFVVIHSSSSLVVVVFVVVRSRGPRPLLSPNATDIFCHSSLAIRRPIVRRVRGCGRGCCLEDAFVAEFDFGIDVEVGGVRSWHL